MPPTPQDRPPGDDELAKLSPFQRDLIEFAAHVETVQPGRGSFTADTDAEHGYYEATLARFRRQRRRGELRRRYYGPANVVASRRIATRSASAPRRARARGAGRPRAQATRSSARSGDSPSDGPAKPAPVAEPRALLTFGVDGYRRAVAR